LLDNINKQRVLVAPLDWGLGHATRCIPIIESLLALGHQVILAGEGAVATVLHKEFPTLEIIPLKGYRVQYAKTGAGFILQIIKQIPRILKTIQAEHAWLDNIIEEKNIDLVISDNRYGLHTKKVPSVFITHQLNIKTANAFLDQLIRKVHYKYIDRFSVCWVPDAKGDKNLGGLLSHPTGLPKIPVHYMGLLSRCKKTNTAIQFKYCFLLSGPEPQRTLLEEKILDQIVAINEPMVLVRGLPNATNYISTEANVMLYQYLNAEQLSEKIAASEWVICRSGYSSLMDLIAMHKKRILIPTPGQTEQVYLAQKLHDQQMGYQLSQSSLCLLKDLDDATKQEQQFPDIAFFTTKTLQDLLMVMQTM
jgi:UDP:flavonoid glycosyltransferase YjiC (YdhE family)